MSERPRPRSQDQLLATTVGPQTFEAIQRGKQRIVFEHAVVQWNNSFYVVTAGKVATVRGLGILEMRVKGPGPEDLPRVAARLMRTLDFVDIRLQRDSKDRCILYRDLWNSRAGTMKLAVEVRLEGIDISGRVASFPKDARLAPLQLEQTTFQMLLGHAYFCLDRSTYE